MGWKDFSSIAISTFEINTSCCHHYTPRSEMWTPWLSSPSTPRRHRKFTTCSSFKDIQQLLHEGDDEDQKQHKRRLILRHNNLFQSIRPLSTDPNPKSQPTTTVVVYFTSLRVVRRTFDDCRTVRSILRSFRVPIVECDVSMDSAFLDELQEMFGSTNKKVSLPRVFVGGRYLGGVEEVRQLHECGELKQMIGVVGFGMRDELRCEVCDGHGFVVCEKCDGSHKVFVEKFGFRSCADCNLNGLIRCPTCFSSH